MATDQCSIVTSVKMNKYFVTKCVEFMFDCLFPDYAYMYIVPY